jgi:hypothetical protein
MPTPWVEQIFRWLGHGRYNATPPALADGEVREMQLDDAGNLKVNLSVGTVTAGEAAAASNAQTTAPASTGVIKSSAGSLLMISGWNESGDDRYLVLCDAVTAPADTTATTTTAFKIFKVPAGSVFSFVPPRGLVFATGISWVCSTTRATLTRSSDFYLVAQYL